MKKNKLQIEQLESKIKLLEPITSIAIPPTGWIKAIRSALGISLQQFANKLSISRQSASEIELREKDGSITIKSLKEAARALDMQLVYGLVPSDGSLDALIERKAMELAKKIVTRTSTTMKLEDQANSPERINKAIRERAQSLKLEMPKILWD
ncbi:mobile mystery protein A [Ekhidna sp.]|uniref:mobile mystery protein A n=1 Tax=Ekhidna sp. TaxID=2608089 RepID=UPI003B504EAD